MRARSSSVSFILSPSYSFVLFYFLSLTFFEPVLIGRLMFISQDKHTAKELHAIGAWLGNKGYSSFLTYQHESYASDLIKFIVRKGSSRPKLEEKSISIICVERFVTRNIRLRPRDALMLESAKNIGKKYRTPDFPTALQSCIAGARCIVAVLLSVIRSIIFRFYAEQNKVSR